MLAVLLAVLFAQDAWDVLYRLEDVSEVVQISGRARSGRRLLPTVAVRGCARKVVATAVTVVERIGCVFCLLYNEQKETRG